MADENVVTNIVATADFSDLIGNVNKLNTELAQLKQSLTNTDKALALQAAKLQQSFSSTLRSTGQFSTHFVSLSSDVEKFGKNLESGKLKLRDYYATWQTHQKTAGGLIRDLAKQQVQLQNSILQPLGRNAEGLMQFNVQIPRGLDAAKNKAALLKQEMQIMNKVIQDGGVQLINWGKNTQWAGRQLTVGLTVPIAAFGKAAADAFKVADEQLVRLTKVYGGVAQTSAAELGKIRKEVQATAKELAQAYGASYTETISLAADIAATGKQGEELLNSTRETTRLSVLGEVDRQEAMKATLAIQTAFNQNTEELANSINFLNAVENQTSTSLADLVEAIPKAGPVVKSLGGDIQDLALYLTAMKEGGVNASEGANAIKSSLASLINPTKVAKEVFMGFGINLEAIVNNNAGNITATILELQKALESLDPLSKSRAIEQLFGKFQFARLSALFDNLGKQGSQTLEVLDLMNASSADLANVAGRELAQITESASGKYRRALEGLKADLAGVGDAFLNIQTFFINLIDKVIDFSNKLPDPIKKILTLVGGLTALAGPAIMLTGVLANFFGYIVKGVAHFKALFKGGEGWKLLTPEIMAAQKAGNLMEATFYSDAKAANILGQAISNLNIELDELTRKAAAGTISAQPVISTVAGQTIMGGGREVVQNHPLVSEKDTRSFSHLNPVSGMTAEQKSAQTIFGVVPGAPLVNQKISNNPQMYMSGDLPKVAGASAIRGVSTGIVSEEAAKWHAMTGALAMQSKQEIALLKREVAATGLITTSLSDSYQALLPEMSRITSLAATESAQIVAELQASKINVDQARAKIIALNQQIEAMMGQAATGVATAQGRTINLTQLPIVDQPAFDPVTGKANMKELTRPRNRTLINKIAQSLGVKTFGAPYSIETTRPKRLNSGGYVYTMQDGPVVPGNTSINYDNTMAQIPEGGYVINQKAAKANPWIAKLSRGYAKGGMVNAMLTPGEIVVDPKTTAENFDMLEAINNGYYNGGGIKKGIKLQRTHITDDLSGLALLLPSWVNLGVNANGSGLTGSQIVAGIKEAMSSGYDPNGLMNEAAVTLGGDKAQAERRNNVALNQLIAKLESPEYADKMIGGKDDQFGFERLAKEIYRPALRGIKIDSSKSGGTRNLYSALSQIFTKRSAQNLTKDEAIARGILSGKPTGSKEMGQIVTRRGGRLSWVSQNKTIGSSVPSWARGTNLSTLLTTASGVSHALKILKRNSGGMIPGYAVGGRIQALTKSMIMKKLGAKFGKQDSGPGWEHKSAQIGMGSKLFGKTGLRPFTQNLLYDALLETTANTRPMGYFKATDGKLFRGIEPNQTDQMLRDAAEIVIRRHAGQISPIDKKILKEQFTHMDLKSVKYAAGIEKQIFGMNAGGMIPGGMIKKGRFNYGLNDPMLADIMGLTPSAPGMPISQGAGGSYMSGLRNPYGKGLLSGMSGKPMGFGAQMGIGMAGGIAGSMVGGNAGMAIMMASNILPMMAAMKGFAGLVPSVAKVASILGRLTIPGAIIGTLTGVIALINKMRGDAEKAGEVNRAMFGGTKEQLAEVGIQYTSVADRIKSIREELELTRAKAESNYASMTSSGIPGLNLTITQLREGIKDAKENAKETVDLFNNIDSARVTELAVSLKAQYVSLGMSVQEATNKIYTLVSASNKSSQALSAITSVGFKEIKDRSSAAAVSVRQLGKVVSDKSLFNVEEFAVGLDAVLNNLDSYMNSLVGTKVDGKMLTESDAFKKTIEEIKTIKSATQNIDEQNLQELKRQDLVLGSMLSNSESILSVFAKYKLYLSGLSDVLNIGAMTGQDAIDAAAGYEALQDAAQSVVGETAIGKAADAARKASENAANAAKSAQKVDASYYDEAIKNKQKLIDKLEEERKKRLEILDLQEQSQSFEISIKQAQMRYQEAIATGNMAQAAQEQLSIQKLSGDRERELARNAINDRYDADRKKLEDEIAALQDKKDALQKAIAVTGTRSQTTAQSAKELSDLENEIAGIASKYAGSPNKGIKEIMAVLADAKKAGGAQAKAADQMIKDYTGRKGYVGSQIETLNPYQAMMNELASKSIDTAKADGTFANAVDLFLNAVKDFKTTVSPQNKVTGSGDTITVGGVTYKKVTSSGVSGTYQIKKASGGYISGAGSGTSDSIPAMLSNGEYVVSAKAVQAAGIPMLDRINKMSKGGPVFDIPAYSMGGRVKYNAGGLATSSNALYNINVTLNGTDLNPNDVARAIDNQMRLREAMNGRGRKI